MKPIMLELTATEAAHVMWLLKANADSGHHYGNARQYWDRHRRLIAKLDEAVRVADDG